MTLDTRLAQMANEMEYEGFFEHGTDCYSCGDSVILAGDAYCQTCGTPQTDTYARMILTDLDTIQPATTERLYGGKLSSAVRKWLKAQGYAKDTHVKTHNGRTRVMVLTDHDTGKDCNGRDRYRTEPHERCKDCERAHDASRQLDRILTRAFPQTAGKVNDNPGADYHYLILPDIFVSTDYRHNPYR